MKLRAKFQDEDFELGEVTDVDIATVPDGRIKAQARSMRGELHTIFYKTKAEFDADWTDAPEEPKGIKSIGTIGSSVHIEMGSEEEAEKALERLHTWKRLKENGFRFVGWKNGKLEYPDYVSFDCKDYKGCAKDLDIIFGGEE